MSDMFNEMTEFFAIKDEEYSNDNGSGDDLFVLNDENWEPKEDANLLFFVASRVDRLDNEQCLLGEPKK